MLFRLKQKDGKPEFYPYPPQSAAALKLAEKDLENWIAAHPELLFGAERVLVIGQSVSGQKMADILALDGDGRLLIIEMKRDWSDRATVGQLLEYAARMADAGTHEQLDKIARNYLKQPETPLSTQFRQFFEDETGEDVKLGSKQRLVIAASSIFGKENEFHLRVKWNVIVPDRGAVTVREVKSRFSYTLPFRSVFCGMSRHDVADWIEDELRHRQGVQASQ